jgi:transposase-like protein
VKVRHDGRVVSMAVVIAVGVRATGEREVLGLDAGPSEDGAFWTQFLRGLVARGLAGVQLVTSDAHEGLKGAIAAVLQGASWQRCRTHTIRTQSQGRRAEAGRRRRLVLVGRAAERDDMADLQRVVVDDDALDERGSLERLRARYGFSVGERGRILFGAPAGGPGGRAG